MAGRYKRIKADIEELGRHSTILWSRAQQEVDDIERDAWLSQRHGILREIRRLQAKKTSLIVRRTTLLALGVIVTGVIGEICAFGGSITLTLNISGPAEIQPSTDRPSNQVRPENRPHGGKPLVR